MMYATLLILGVGLVATVLAVPLTVMVLRLLDKPTPTPISEPAPVPETPSGPERIDRVARRGRR